MLPERLKSLIARFTEVAASLALVLLSFLAILFLLGLSFPEGTGLRSLMAGDQAGTLAFDRGGKGFDIGGRLRAGARDAVPFIARLASTHRKVKDKRAGSIAWSDSVQGTPLQDRHAIQTFARSGATVSFEDEGGQLRLGESSLVVLRRVDRDRRSTTRRASLAILAGELQAEVAAGNPHPIELELATPGGTATVRQGPSAQSGTGIRVTVDADRSSVISVFDGVAQIQAGGRTLLVRPDEGLRLEADGTAHPPMALPRRPRPGRPFEDASYRYRDLPPRIEFEWSGGPDADAYRLLIARDPGFEDVVHDGRTSDARFTHGNLPEGRYFWKVRALRRWAQSRDSEPRALAVVRDTVPPKLAVDLPEGAIAASEWLIRGTTEPDAAVFIADTPVPVDDEGRFEHAHPLRRGLNVVVVEAIDRAGNSTYRSALVTAKY